MTVTANYTAAHAAFAHIARRHALTPHNVRVLLAVHERAGTARSDILAHDLGVVGGGAHLRHSLLKLYDLELAIGHPRRVGVRTTVTLTPAGRDIAEETVRLEHTIRTEDLERRHPALPRHSLDEQPPPPDEQPAGAAIAW